MYLSPYHTYFHPVSQLSTLLEAPMYCMMTSKMTIYCSAKMLVFWIINMWFMYVFGFLKACKITHIDLQICEDLFNCEFFIMNKAMCWKYSKHNIYKWKCKQYPKGPTRHDSWHGHLYNVCANQSYYFGGGSLFICLNYCLLFIDCQSLFQ